MMLLMATPTDQVEVEAMLPTASDTERFIAGRDRVLGRRCVITEDDDTTCQTLAAFFGGERRAAAALRRWLRQLDPGEWTR